MLINANGADGIKCYDTVKRPGGVSVVYRMVIKTPDTQTSLCALSRGPRVFGPSAASCLPLTI